MAGKTTIEWTAQPGFEGAVWNPSVGCTRVSAGCDHCYAFALHDRRYKANLDHARANGEGSPAMMRMVLSSASLTVDRDLWPPFPKQYDLPFSRVQLLEDRLDVPLRTRKPTCYFVDSMADLFHEDVPDEYLDRVWAVMVGASWHRFLILTKRPDRMRAYTERRYHEVASPPAPNIWLGTSVEDQAAADERIPHLLATPAAVRFLSCEPLLGPVDIGDVLRLRDCPCRCHRDGMAVLTACVECPNPHSDARLQWVIVGGESGPRARPMDLAWARSLVQQCVAAGVAVFVKQLGSKPLGKTLAFEAIAPGNFAGRWKSAPMKLCESHGRDMAEWPEDLRIREWPR